MIYLSTWLINIHTNQRKGHLQEDSQGPTLDA